MLPTCTRERLVTGEGGLSAYSQPQCRGGAVSTPREHDENSRRPPTRDEILARGRPFPAYEEMVIDGLTDQEEDLFLQAIADA
jgi:hypothetical protein